MCFCFFAHILKSIIAMKIQNVLRIFPFCFSWSKAWCFAPRPRDLSDQQAPGRLRPLGSSGAALGS